MQAAGWLRGWKSPLAALTLEVAHAGLALLRVLAVETKLAATFLEALTRRTHERCRRSLMPRRVPYLEDAAMSCFSGCWRYVHVEGEGLGVGVAVAGAAFQGERDGGHAVALGVLAGEGAAAVDVQGRHAVMSVAGFVVEEQLDPQRAHHLIVV